MIQFLPMRLRKELAPTKANLIKTVRMDSMELRQTLRGGGWIDAGEIYKLDLRESSNRDGHVWEKYVLPKPARKKTNMRKLTSENTRESS